MTAPGERYRADLARIEAFIDKLAKFGEKSEQKTSEIEQKHNELRGAWSGEGADAHAELRNKWNAGEAEMRDGLAKLKEQAGGDHERYKGLIEHQRGMWP